MKYIKKFDAVSAQTAYLESTKLDTYVGYVSENDSVYYEDAIPDYSKMYLTFDIISGGTLMWRADTNYTITARTISYSLDNGSTWTDITAGKYSNPPTINVNAGDKVLLKGNNTTYGAANYGNYFSGTAVFNAAGNIMSLISGDSFQNATEITGQYVFAFIFKGAQLISAENLIFPDITLSVWCYEDVFHNCTSLTIAPSILPATTLSNGCYSRMFQGCTSLTTAPSLPATTLVSSCYSQMFRDCTSLTSAPELPATELVMGCYSNMFNGCTSLTTAPALPATTVVNSCYDSMFKGCTSLTTAPELPATTLVANACYGSMFSGCTNLNYVKCLATENLNNGYASNWLTDVSATGTFVKDANATWPSGASGIPDGWTIQNA